MPVSVAAVQPPPRALVARSGLHTRVYVAHSAGMRVTDPQAREVGERIRSLRAEHKTKRAALARLCGRDPKTVWRWEHGLTLVDSASALAICRAYEVSADWLLLGREPAEAA